MRESTTLIHVDPTALETDPENIRREGPGDLERSRRAFGSTVCAARRRSSTEWWPAHRVRESPPRCGDHRRTADDPLLLLEPRDDDRLVWQLLENLQRRDLNDLDKADGLARLRRRIGRDAGEVSERELDERTGREVGLSAATVRRYLGLRELAPGVRDLLAEGELSVTQAQHLRGLSDAALQESLARLAAERGSSAAVLGRAARLLSSQPSMSPDEALDQAERGVEAIARREPIEELTRLARPPRAADDYEKEDRADEPDEDERDGPGRRRRTGIDVSRSRVWAPSRMRQIGSPGRCRRATWRARQAKNRTRLSSSGSRCGSSAS